MKQTKLMLMLIFVTSFSACKKNVPMNFDTTLQPPDAEKTPFQLKKHDDIRIDPYYWMRERENPEVIDYLERENDYFKKMTQDTESFREDLFEELKSRIKEEDNSVPYFHNDYWYITRYEKGKQYPIYTRKKDSMTAPEEILFDCNQMAEGHDYFRLVGINVSPDNTKVVYGVDTESRRKYTLHVKDLLSGQILDTNILNTSGASAWSLDNQHFFYTKKNTETLRSEWIFRHDLETPNGKDELIFHEQDETFSVWVRESKSNDYIMISSYSTLTTEQQFLDAKDPLGKFQVIQPRTRGLEYSAAQFEDNFYILHNSNDAKNYKISKAPISNPGIEQWEDLLPHRKDVLLEDFEIFKDHFVITERKNGLTSMRIQRWDGTADYFLPVEGETYSLYGAYNPSFETSKLRYGFTSLRTPSSVYEFDMETQETILLKQQEVMDQNFSPEHYVEKRIWATARDGEKIPISLIHHKDTKLNEKTPLYQYAYGSYGSTVDPGFSSSRLSLLDRGFVFAITHIRGGEYLGRQWYENGKLFKKKNTFNDFIDASQFLIDSKMTSAAHLHAAGGSAGGLLMGVVVNQAPELYRSVIAAVPFVDVVTTMLDESIPLTTSEYDEWGNPNDESYYDYMLSYSPYDNVEAQKYPNMLVTAGYHDSQVQYWEPAKWVAKLRDVKTDTNVLFLDTNMEAGHSGASGRFNALKDIAKQYTFILQLEGKLD
ncbi:MAG: S9 family peptidase [Flavobacteriaceae bacterium]|jgi:oligopeptidase B|nr:S9 family peptidase [Flavobacteriaceae bacterium]